MKEISENYHCDFHGRTKMSRNCSVLINGVVLPEVPVIINLGDRDQSSKFLKALKPSECNEKVLNFFLKTFLL